MWKSQNVSDAAFVKLYDYPRDRYSVDRKSTQEVTILKFDLLPEETEDLVSHLSQAPAAEPGHIIYTTFYDGEDKVRKEVRFDKALQSRSSGAVARAAIEAVTKVIDAQDGEDLDPVHAASTNVEGGVKTVRIGSLKTGEESLRTQGSQVAGAVLETLRTILMFNMKRRMNAQLKKMSHISNE